VGGIYMFIIERIAWQKDAPEWNIVFPILEKIFGYASEEAQGFREVVDIGYNPPFAINLNDEQIVSIIQPFIDADLAGSVWAEEYDDVTHELLNMYPDADELFGFAPKNNRFTFEWDKKPQQHYDEPIVLKYQRVDPFNPPNFYGTDRWRNATFTPQYFPPNQVVSKPSKPIVTCPYCKSEKTTKISSFEKATNIFMFGIFGQKRKYQWHCNNCKSDF